MRGRAPRIPVARLTVAISEAPVNQAKSAVACGGILRTLEIPIVVVGFLGLAHHVGRARTGEEIVVFVRRR